MKGLSKALARTPFAVTSKIGMSKKSSDPEFEEYHRQFEMLESGTEKLLKDTKAFVDAVTSLFTSGTGFGTHFAAIMTPIQGEYDLLGKNPDAAHTIRNVNHYQTAMEELQQLIAPELELINTRIQAPVKEFQFIVKTIRKTITKREHKLTDYDRHNNSLTKLRDKKEKSLSDEKNLFKLEQEFEISTNEYEYINTALKQDLPRFMQLATAFIDPLFNSFFYMQLNIYYLLLEKMQSFADNSKYDIANAPGPQIQHDYESKRTDAWEHIETLGIIKRIVSVSRLVQAQRSQGGPAGVSRANTVASTASSSYASGKGPAPAPPPSRAVSGAGYKKAPPPPPGASSYAPPPPPYSPASAAGGSHLPMPEPSVVRASSASSSLAATKRPPPPPPVKPKPKPAAIYVTALYDFDAQASMILEINNSKVLTMRQAEGDLSFRAGERIELVKKTDSQEDWWTGRLNGQEGIFPGNYVQEQ